MRFLFVKHELCWPRASGHDVHTFGMMSALKEAGHAVELLTCNPCRAEALGSLRLDSQSTFVGNDANDGGGPLSGMTRLQQKFCGYWGVPSGRVAEVADRAERSRADVVVAVGLEVLPYLAGVRNARRIWYAADEWVVHHLSQFFPWQTRSWHHLRPAAVKGLYEWAFASRVDRVWLVSQRDATATRLVMRGVATDVVPNGVDTEHYCPQQVSETERSCVFWGRLDFGPNLDAIRWFTDKVWQPLKRRHPDVSFTVFGFKPGEEIRKLAARHDFKLITDQEDIRADICRRQLVVLPFVSGTGIKNKLLEAAALGRPILASKTATNGVDLGDGKPLQVAGSPGDWITAIRRLWEDADQRRQLGDEARRWVRRDYTWSAAARRVVAGLGG